MLVTKWSTHTEDWGGELAYLNNKQKMECELNSGSKERCKNKMEYE